MENKQINQICIMFLASVYLSFNFVDWFKQ